MSYNKIETLPDLSAHQCLTSLTLDCILEKALGTREWGLGVRWLKLLVLELMALVFVTCSSTTIGLFVSVVLMDVMLLHCSRFNCFSPSQLFYYTYILIYLNCLQG